MANFNLTNSQASFFFERSSFAGLLAIYALSLSYSKKIAFDKGDFIKTAFITSDDYFYGFIIGCSSVGVISFNHKGTVITVTYVDEQLLTRIEGEINKRTSDQENWKIGVKNVKEYFN